MKHRTLWCDSNQGLISCSVDSFDLSPIYVLVNAARSLIEKGVHVALPDGYTIDELNGIAWATGEYGRMVPVSERQAQEVVQIAYTLLGQHVHQISPAVRDAASQVIQTVITEEN